MSETSDTSETFETSEMKKSKVCHLLDEAIQGVGVGKELHDVTFLILDDAGECLGEIPAHKFVLSLDSVIFRWGFAHPGFLHKDIGLRINCFLKLLPFYRQGKISLGSRMSNQDINSF
jgi:hypothetical protein